MAVVAVVRAAGGRVAVHAAGRAGGGLRQPRRDQRVGGDGGRRSIQHGTCLDPELLPWMAVSGTALTPTLSVIAAGLAKRPEPAGGRGSDWFTIGAKAHGSLIVQAAEAGLTLLAGTDSRPHGQIVDEIGALVAAGLRARDAGSLRAPSRPRRGPRAPILACLPSSEARLLMQSTTLPTRVRTSASSPRRPR